MPILQRYALASLSVSVAVVSVKLAAAYLTGAVGWLADAAESLANVAGAIAVLVAVRQASKSPDEAFPWGRKRAENAAALFEGTLIAVAAVAILWQAAVRFVNPMEVSSLGWGAGLTGVATALNAGMGLVLLRAGRKHSSPALRADGKHLITDVWTSLGVLAAAAGIAVTGWSWLDPAIAVIIGVIILVTAYRIVAEELFRLMDGSDPEASAKVLKMARQVALSYDGVEVSAARTRTLGGDTLAEIELVTAGDYQDYMAAARSALAGVAEVRFTLSEDQ